MQLSKAFLLFFVLLLSACANSSNNTADKEHKLNPKTDSLYKLVVAKHDEVMPKTADITKLSNTLRKQLGNEKDANVKDKILKLLQGLQKGYDAMFDWMNEFKNEHLNKDFYEKESTEKILAYLKEEEKKIEGVAKLMLEGIEQAELYLKDINK